MNGDSLTTNLPVRPSKNAPTYSAATLAIHADDALGEHTDVAPALHLSTTFRYPSDPSLLKPTSSSSPPSRDPHDHPPSSSYIYSRVSAPNTSRLEAILTSLFAAPTLTYSSGLAAFHALLVHVRPNVVAIGAGYHGCHGVLALYQKLTHCRIVDLHDTSSWSGEGWTLGKGDLVHLETPLNPTGEAYNISAFAQEAHKRGALLSIDATFAPPPLLDPWKWGADFVMHSGTKYIGGHSDMLCGVVAIGKQRQGWEEAYWGMYNERVFLGSVMGSLEGWLGVRSVRTLELRVQRQSWNTTELVGWLEGLMRGAKNEREHGSANVAEDSAVEVVRGAVERLQHASLQHEDKAWLDKQMPNGYGPVFAIWMKDSDFARRLPSKLHLFHHATSLGGVESLIEWRRMSDETVDERVLRVSIGVEDVRDLKQDLLQGFRALLAEMTNGK